MPYVYYILTVLRLFNYTKPFKKLPKAEMEEGNAGVTRPEERSSQRRRRKGTKLPEEQGMENERMGNGA